jgi:GTPase SAR1 family protein
MDVLVMGPSGSGKSLFTRRVCNHIKRVEQPDVVPTIPTVGVELVTTGTKAAPGLTLREIGGSMGLDWPKLYDICSGVVIVIDVADIVKLSDGCTLVLELIGKPALQGKPILLLLNKADLPNAMPKRHIRKLLRLDEIGDSSARVTIVPSSMRLSCLRGFEEALEWLQKI